MKTSQLFQTLASNQSLELHFNIQGHGNIAPGFHLTEVKNVSIQSVDCGGKSHEEKEVILQLMDGNPEKPAEILTAAKATSILKKVQEKLNLFSEEQVFVEYGNLELNFAKYAVSKIEQTETSWQVSLSPLHSQCKPRVAAQQNACC